MKDMLHLRIVAICSNIAFICVESAARIDPARHPLAPERLAIDGGVEATQCEDGGPVFHSVPTYCRLHRGLS